VCLFTVHVGSGSSPLSCGVFLPWPLLQAFPLLITGWCCCSCQPPCLFTVYVGSGSSLLSCGVFLPLPLSQAFLFLVARCVPPLPPEPLWPARLVYLQSREVLQCSVCPTLFFRVSLLFLLLIVSFTRVEVGLSRGLCYSGPDLSVGVPWYREAHLVRIFPSGLGTGNWWPEGPPCFFI
jgi:hypothetical protein